MSIQPYQIYAVISLACYGFWGFWGAKTSNIISPKSAIIYSSIGTLLVAIICLSLLHFKPQISGKGISFGVLTGLSTGLGTLFFIAALRIGPAIPIVMTTALYPLVTTILLIVLTGENLTLTQGLGILFSMVAIFLLNY